VNICISFSSFVQSDHVQILFSVFVTNFCFHIHSKLFCYPEVLFLNRGNATGFLIEKFCGLIKVLQSDPGILPSEKYEHSCPLRFQFTVYKFIPNTRLELHSYLIFRTTLERVIVFYVW